MSMTARVLIGLALGLTLGIGAAATRQPGLLAAAPVIEPIGSLWLNALRMTVIPLLVSLLVTSVASTSRAATTGRLAGRTVLLVLGFLFASSLFVSFLMPAMLAARPLDPGTVAVLRGMIGGGDAIADVPTAGEWITGLVPANVIQAAADGAILPMVVFAALLGLAIPRLQPVAGDHLLTFFGAVRDAMLVIVHWVLQLSPLGIFALVFPFAASAGSHLIGALSYYTVTQVILCVVLTLAMYPLARVAAGIPLHRFAAAAAPAQAVAFSTRSSLASLPAMLTAARTRLGVEPAVAELVLPLAVTLMRVTGPAVNLGRTLFVAALYDIHPGPALLAAAAVVAVATSLGSVGMPSQVTFMASNIPVFQVLGVPIEALALLIGIEVVLDMFRTLGNVTADLVLVGIVSRSSPATASPAL